MPTTPPKPTTATGPGGHVVQEGLPAVIATEACCLGRQESPKPLAVPVGARIPG